MSGVLLVVVSSINAEYEWNGKEWIWKETPTVSISLISKQELQYEQKCNLSHRNNYLKSHKFDYRYDRMPPREVEIMSMKM